MVTIWHFPKKDYKGHGKVLGVFSDSKGNAKCFDCGHEWFDAHVGWAEMPEPGKDCISQVEAEQRNLSLAQHELTLVKNPRSKVQDLLAWARIASKDFRYKDAPRQIAEAVELLKELAKRS